MLLKQGDRLTSDGFLALRAFGKVGEAAALKALLETVRTLSPRQGELPFHTDPAKGVRFMWNGEQPRVLSTAEVRDLFFAESGAPPILLPVTYSLRADPKKLEAFLASEAHETLAFRPEPLLLIHLGGTKPVVVFAQEGRFGRKYRRTKNDVVDFLGTHPQGATIFSDLEMRMMFRESIKSPEDLARFIDQDERRLDLVIDQVQLVAGYLFDADAFDAAIAAKKEWFLEPNEEGYATVDFQFSAGEAGGGPLTPLPFAPARSALQAALTDIAAFAAEQDLKEDQAYFDEVRQGLDQAEGALPPLFQLNAMSPAAHALYRAAIRADVFAGMASWNDVQIEKTAAYRHVSNRLCLAVLDAICAACSPDR